MDRSQAPTWSDIQESLDRGQSSADLLDAHYPRSTSSSIGSGRYIDNQSYMNDNMTDSDLDSITGADRQTNKKQWFGGRRNKNKNKNNKRAPTADDYFQDEFQPQASATSRILPCFIGCVCLLILALIGFFVYLFVFGNGNETLNGINSNNSNNETNATDVPTLSPTTAAPTRTPTLAPTPVPLWIASAADVAASSNDETLVASSIRGDGRRMVVASQGSTQLSLQTYTRASVQDDWTTAGAPLIVPLPVVDVNERRVQGDDESNIFDQNATASNETVSDDAVDNNADGDDDNSHNSTIVLPVNISNLAVQAGENNASNKDGENNNNGGAAAAVSMDVTAPTAVQWSGPDRLLVLARHVGVQVFETSSSNNNNSNTWTPVGQLLRAVDPEARAVLDGNGRRLVYGTGFYKYDRRWVQDLQYQNNILAYYKVGPMVQISGDGRRVVHWVQIDANSLPAIEVFQQNASGWYSLGLVHHQADDETSDLTDFVLSHDGNALAIADGSQVVVYAWENNAWAVRGEAIAQELEQLALSEDGMLLAGVSSSFAGKLFEFVGGAWSDLDGLTLIEPNYEIVSLSLAHQTLTLGLSSTTGEGSLIRTYRPESAETASVPRVCNGLASLCRRSVADVTFATAHNANADSSQSGPIRNHVQAVVPGALEAGVRGLNFDIGLCPIDAGNATMALRLVHEACALGAIDPTAFLLGILDFLEANPHEVIIMPVQINDQAGGIVPLSLVADLFNQTRRQKSVMDYLYKLPAPDAAMPTLNDLIDVDQRILFFVSHGAENCTTTACLPGFHDWFRYAVENPVLFESAEDVLASNTSCVLDRGASGAKVFYGVNTFLRIPNQDAADTLNQQAVVFDHLHACEEITGLRPNLVLYDFWSVGSVVDAVEQFNREFVDPDAPPSRAPMAAPSSAPTWVEDDTFRWTESKGQISTGDRVALDFDGTTVLVGSGNGAGVYELSAQDGWKETSSRLSDAIPESELGTEVGISDGSSEVGQRVLLRFGEGWIVAELDPLLGWTRVGSPINSETCCGDITSDGLGLAVGEEVYDFDTATQDWVGRGWNATKHEIFTLDVNDDITSLVYVYYDTFLREAIVEDFRTGGKLYEDIEAGPFQDKNVCLDRSSDGKALIVGAGIQISFYDDGAFQSEIYASSSLVDVSISDDGTAAVAMTENVAYVFDLNANNDWTIVASLVADGGHSFSSVSMAGNGNRIAFGSRRSTDEYQVRFLSRQSGLE